MRNESVLAAKMRSPLREAMTVDPSARSGGSKRKMVISLVLTSLVDVFSIMLLYLLVQNSGNGSTIELQKLENLPSATKTEALHQGTLVRVEDGRYFLDDQPVDQVGLAQKLQELKARLGSGGGDASQALIIQADRAVDFASLTPVIRAGSISGFNKFKFAVLQGEGRL